MSYLPVLPIADASQAVPGDVPATLRAAILDLLGHCRRNLWAGHDPYDALNSRVLRSLGLLQWQVPRLVATQFLKRCPINLRSLLGVPRQQNPKGIAVFLSAIARLHGAGLTDEKDVHALATRLLELRSANQPWSCWGYNFDWQTRTYLVPRFTPNVICTTFAGNALLDAYDAFGNESWLDAAQSAGEFILNGLNRSEAGDTFCFSYTPLDRGQVHNASLLGAGFLARLHTYQPREAFRESCFAATRYSLDRQRPDGSWPYGEGPNQQWIDSFHTGYNLVALECVRRCVGLEECESAVRRGYQFYLDHFFEPDGRVKYYHNRTYPIDSHSIAQALITLTRLARYDGRSLPLAERVCDWALRNMRSPEGRFYYQKWPLWTNRIKYMRWSQAWMLLGMAELLAAECGAKG